MNRSKNQAFTLVETLAVIGVIAIIIAIVLPSLSASRTMAGLNVHRSNMRDCLNSIAIYSQSYRDRFPFMGVPGQPERGVAEFNDLISPDEGLSYNAGYFSANSFHWPTVLKRAGFDIEFVSEPDDEHRQRLQERYGNSEILGSAYQLSHTLVAAPAYWQNTANQDPSYFRPMNTSRIRYPSKKGTMLALRLGVFEDGENDWVVVGFGDNSVSKRRFIADNGLEHRPYYSCLPFAVITTVNGIEGQDY